MGDDRRELRLKVVVVLLAISVPLVLALLVMAAIASGMCLGPPCTPDPAPDDLLTAAFIVGTLGSVVGIALSFRTGQVVSAVVLSFVLALTLFVWVSELIEDVRRNPPEPVPSHSEHCLEHSGGESTCPGG